MVSDATEQDFLNTTFLKKVVVNFFNKFEKGSVKNFDVIMT